MPNYVILEIHLPPAHQLPIEIQGDLGMAEVEAVEAMDLDMHYMKLKLILQNL